MKNVELPIGTLDVYNTIMTSEALNLEGVVVTALGVTREKKSLGYSSQEIKGGSLSQLHENNFINSLSGKVSGI